eukprot:EG_transcript_17348
MACSAARQSGALFTTAVDLSVIQRDLRTLGGGEVRLTGLDQPVALLEVDNAAARNALSGKMMAELRDAVAELERWDGAGVVLTGCHGTFCSGADLSVVRSHMAEGPAGRAMCLLMQDTLRRLHDCDVISVAAVEGKALGGGAELTTACDFRAMARDATIQFLQARMGVSTGWGGGERLVQLVGRRQALRLLPGTHGLSSDAALRCGFADCEADSGQAVAAARQWLQPFLEPAKHVVKQQKRMIVTYGAGDLPAARQFEVDLFAGLWGGPANKAALARSSKGRRADPA